MFSAWGASNFIQVVLCLCLNKFHLWFLNGMNSFLGWEGLESHCWIFWFIWWVSVVKPASFEVNGKMSWISEDILIFLWNLALNFLGFLTKPKHSFLCFFQSRLQLFSSVSLLLLKNSFLSSTFKNRILYSWHLLFQTIKQAGSIIIFWLNIFSIIMSIVGHSISNASTSARAFVSLFFLLIVCIKTPLFSIYEK